VGAGAGPGAQGEEPAAGGHLQHDRPGKGQEGGGEVAEPELRRQRGERIEGHAPGWSGPPCPRVSGGRRPVPDYADAASRAGAVPRASRAATMASMSGAGSKRTGSVAGRPVSCSARAQATRASSSSRS